MRDMEARMVVERYTVLRCPECGYARRIPGVCVLGELDMECPACIDPSKCCGWAMTTKKEKTL